MFHTRDFNRQFEFLNGKGISGLLTHIKAERGGVRNVLDQAGIQVTAEDVIVLLQTDRKFVWDTVPIRVIGELLERAATELGKPTSLLMVDDLGKSYVFLNNHSLNRLKGYLRQRFNSDNGQKMDQLMGEIGIFIQTEDVISATKNGHRVYWERLSKSAILGLLEMAAAENGISIEGLGVRDFIMPMAFLDGKNLSSLYNFFYNQQEERGEKDVVLFILDKLGISITAEGAISRLRAGVIVRWDHLPFEEMKKILEIAAGEIHVPLSMLSMADFGKRPFKAFNGRSLGGLYAHLRNHPQKREDMSIPDFLFEALGVRVTTEDVLACFANECPVFWNRVPWTETRKILDMITAEAQIPTYMVGYPQLFRYFESLSNHRLTGLYSYALHHPEKGSEETAIAFIRRKSGLPEPPAALTRSNFRKSQIEESYQHLLPNINFVQLQDMDEIMSWIKKVGKLYASTYLEIESDEVESEVVVFLSEELKGETILGTVKGLIDRLHKKLEAFLHEASKRRYKEISLQANLVNTKGKNYILEGVIQTYDPDPFDDSGKLSDEMQAHLTKLSPLQRRIVIEIAIEGKDLDYVAEELNIDSDILQEYYFDALLLLREIKNL